jgi:hypothetical protein
VEQSSAEPVAVEPAISVERPVSEPSINGVRPKRRATRRAAKPAPSANEGTED